MKILLNSYKYPNLFTEIDDDYYDEVSNYKWHPHQSRKNTPFYAVCHQYNNIQKNLRLHRLIMSLAGHDITTQQVDHIDHDTLNNKTENLRLCTSQQNSMNRIKNGYKGVRVIGNNYYARIEFNKKEYYLGSYQTADEAALAYNKKAIELFGEFANLNVIKEINV